MATIACTTRPTGWDINAKEGGAPPHVALATGPLLQGLVQLRTRRWRSGLSAVTASALLR